MQFSHASLPALLHSHALTHVISQMLEVPLLLQTIVSLLKLRPSLIRGNASEIMAIAGAAGAVTRGVDSTADTSDALTSGKQLAKEYRCIVGISGANDLVGPSLEF